MSVDLYDLGRRLRAATTGQPADSQVSPSCPQPAAGTIAVTVDGPGDGSGDAAAVTVHPYGEAPAHAAGYDNALALFRFDPAETVSRFPRLVVESRSQLRKLVEWANGIPAGHPDENVGWLIDWWAQRAEHPDTTAVTAVVSAAARRWVTGDGAKAERSLDTWRRWLGVTAADHTGLLFAVASAAGDPSEGDYRRHTGYAVDQDTRSWERLRSMAQKDPGGWRRRDSVTVAAVGLLTRSASADRHDRDLLEDPLRRARAAYEGRVVPGAVTAVTETGRREITAAFGVVRFRAGTTVMVEDPAAHTSVPARVEHVAVAADGNVTLTVGPLGRYRVKDFAKVTAGTAVVVSPDTVNVSRDTTSVINAVRRLKSGSWVHHPKRRAPRISRDVPLDVLVAAADTGTG